MSDKTGIERLRELKNTRMVSAVRVGTVPCRPVDDEEIDSIADQIEREHAEELAAAKRDLTDETREVVERLREVSHDDILRSANPEHEIVNELCKAFGVERNLTYTGTLDAMSNRVIELIEHGGRQDVDAATLLELADKLEAVRKDQCNRWLYSGDKESLGATAALFMVPERIREAIEGAHKPILPASEACMASVEAHARQCERDKAADWVEQQGGLAVVDDYPKMDGFVARLATDLGVSDDVGCGDDLRDAVMDVISEYRETLVKIGCKLGYENGDLPVLPELLLGELDKRLMPPDMEWMRFGDGKRVEFGDSWLDGLGDPHVLHAVEFRDREAAEMGARVIMRGRTYSNDDSIEYNLWPGERVKRPEPEVRGSDGLPIVEGDTVYLDDEHAGMAGGSGGEFALLGIDQGSDLTVSRIADGKVRLVEYCALCPASWLTHTPPDSQERIEDDATRDPTTYCNDVLGWDAHKVVRYSDDAAQIEAMVFDLLRRQRELDAKTMGGE